jgi:DNA-binding NtrC family response regulator
MADLIVGIDLGTTNSEIAAFVDGKPQVIGNGSQLMLPSCVGLSPSGDLLIGEPARNQMLLYPERTVRSVKRLMGSNQRVKVDVRVIAATNRDLEAAYKNGTFRKDLYFRLNVVTLYVPALRERRSDIPMLVHWFLERYSPGSEMHVGSAAMKALMQYDWPGNVRELENCVERAVALGNGQIIDLGDLPPAIASGATASMGPAVPTNAKTSMLDPDLAASIPDSPRSAASTTDLEDIERATIQRVFEQVKGDKALAGRMLGISRATLYRKLKEYSSQA